MNRSTDKQRSRMQADREELAERISSAMPCDGRAEIQPGIFFNRFSTPGEPVYGVFEPSFCVIAQGCKDVQLGDDRFHYDPSHYLIGTLGLPISGQIVEACDDKPYLSLQLVLDPSVVTSVMVECGAAQSRGDVGVKGVDVSALDADLLDATLRLVRLTERPSEYRALGAMVIREIVYRLLSGAQSGRMRHLATFGGQTHRMVLAAEKLRQNYNKPLRIEDVANELGMSVSGFHAHFKAVTAMSPLQFQKHIRLQEARRLMLSENCDAGEAGYKVGYDDASHFSRDYKRHFGEPPSRDVERLRELSTS